MGNFGDRFSYKKLSDKQEDHDLSIGEKEECGDENNNMKISSANAFWNICNSIQGVAILAMPHVIEGGGWLSGVALVVVAAISNYTGQILIKCHYDEVKDKDSDEIVYIRTR